MSNLPLLVSFTHWKGVWQWGNRTGIRLNLSWYGRHTVIRQIPLTVRWWGHKSLDLHSIPVSCTNVPESCFIASFDNYKRVKTRWTCQRLSDAIVRKKVQRRICFKAAPGFESRETDTTWAICIYICFSISSDYWYDLQCVLSYCPEHQRAQRSSV